MSNTYTLTQNQNANTPDGEKMIQYSVQPAPQMMSFSINQLKQQKAQILTQITTLQDQDATIDAQIDDAISQLSLKP